MICETCHGARMIEAPATAPVPCPECYGTGITSCCEGACGGPGEITNQPIGALMSPVETVRTAAVEEHTR